MKIHNPDRMIANYILQEAKKNFQPIAATIAIHLQYFNNATSIVRVCPGQCKTKRIEGPDEVCFTRFSELYVDISPSRHIYNDNFESMCMFLLQSDDLHPLTNWLIARKDANCDFVLNFKESRRVINQLDRMYKLFTL